MRRAGSVMALVIASVALGAGPARTAETANLLKDPGAELGGYGDWETANGFAIEAYGAENRPSKAVGDSIGGGADVFAGGSDAQQSSATQTVAVGAQAKAIDGGASTARLAGHLGGVDDEGDYAEVTAEFLPADGDAALGAPVKIGPVTAAERGNQTALLPRSASGAVPPGTRRIRVTITATRVFGVYTDGYADNLSLTLDGADATPTPTATATPARPTSVSVKRRGRRIKGRVQATAPCRAGRRVVIKKGSKTVGRTRSKASGRFTLKTKKAKKGKLTVKVKSRTVGSTVCRSSTKKV